MNGYCGLDCGQCGAFIATRDDDDALRAKVSAEWSKLHNADIKPEHINCTGCQSTGIKFHYCDQLCPIRKCAMSKTLSTCAPCPDFPCALVNPVLQMSPQAKNTLEALRAK